MLPHSVVSNFCYFECLLYGEHITDFVRQPFFDKRTIRNALRLRSGHIQRNLIFIIRHQKRLRAFLMPFFTGGAAAANGKLPRWFPAETSRGGIPLPSKPAALPPVPHSVADATSLPGRGESVQGDGF